MKMKATNGKKMIERLWKWLRTFRCQNGNHLFRDIDIILFKCEYRAGIIDAQIPCDVCGLKFTLADLRDITHARLGITRNIEKVE